MKDFLEKLKKNLPHKITFQKAIEKLAKGELFQQQLGISDEMMQKFYDVSFSYYTAGHYKEACDCFLFMCALNPIESTLWIKAGNAAEKIGAYDEALESYSMAMFCDPDDPFPHLYSAQIYHERHETEKAKACREICLRLIKENTAYEPLQKLALKDPYEKNHC